MLLIYLYHRGRQITACGQIRPEKNTAAVLAKNLHFLIKKNKQIQFTTMLSI